MKGALEKDKRNKIQFINKMKDSLLVVALPIVIYMICGPVEIYCGNAREFLFGLFDFFPLLFVEALLIWCVISVFISLLNERIGYLLRVIIFGIGVCSYLQNLFWNIKLSEANGSPMDWESIGYFPLINALFWLVIIGLVIFLAYCRRKKYSRFLNYISVFLCIIQLIAVGTLVITSIQKDKESDLEPHISGERQFSLAKKDNIVVFVLDTFGNTQLETALIQYPDMLDGFSDFTFYDNADCHYYCTFPSMTHILTGNDFDFSSESTEWLEKSWTSERAEKFYSILHDEKFTVNLYSGEDSVIYGDIRNLQGKFDNIHPVELQVDNKKVCKLLVKMSAYRYVPYVFKPALEVLNYEFSDTVIPKEEVPEKTANGEFYAALRHNRLSIDKSMVNALIVQHLGGTHRPYLLNEKAESVEEECTMEETVKGLFVILSQYIEEMKKLGLYDSATIIITADHGSWGNDPQPIFFLKQANEKHDIMQINTAPISADDFQATILSFLNISEPDFGTSIFDWKDGQERERTVYMRYTDENYPVVTGSFWNVYYKYTYTTNKQELVDKIISGDKEIVPATPWKDSLIP